MNTQTKNAITGAKAKGVYLVNAHGTLASPDKIRKKVPPNTAIYFLADPGYCLDIPLTLGVQNEFFTTKQKLHNFLYRAGNAVNKPRNVNINYVHDVHGRIRLPGQRYLNMYVNVIPDKEYPTMGYVKRLPTTRSNQVPTFNQIVPLHPGKYLLSEYIRNYHPQGGIFIISSCRAIPGNRTRFRNANTRNSPARGTAWTNAITTNQFRPTIKGRPARKQSISLRPIREKTVKSRKYPPAMLRKLRTAVTKGGQNLWTALLSLKAPANLPMRVPGEMNFLKLQERLAKKPLSKVRVLRSGIRSLRK
jgi:hypothetical protein